MFFTIAVLKFGFVDVLNEYQSQSDHRLVPEQSCGVSTGAME